MHHHNFSAIALSMAAAVSAHSATTVTIGPSGRTFASAAVQCAPVPGDASGARAPMVQAGLFNPKPNASAVLSLDGVAKASLSAASPVTEVWLASGPHRVVIALTRKTADTYDFNVPTGMCKLPDTSGNTFSTDGSLEYAASGKSYATVVPGCALNPQTGQAQPYVNLFDNGGFLLNVAINGTALTQLSATRPHTPVFLGAGTNVISAANGSLSIDYYLREGGTGLCTLP